MKKINTKEIFHLAWESFKMHWGILIGALAIIIAVEIALGLFGDMVEVENEFTIQAFLLSLFSIFVGVMLQMGIIQIQLNLVKGYPAEIGQIVGDFSLALRYFATSIVYALIVFAGILLLIVPGIIWGIKYSQWSYLMIDRRLGIMEALRESARITDGSKSDMVITYLALIGITILSLIPLGLGLIVSIPFTMMAYAHMYKKLAYAESVAPVQEEISEPMGSDSAPVEPSEEKYK